MNQPASGEATPVEAAMRRFDAAVEALEAAVERRLEVERQEAALAAQLHVMGADRSRLAALARSVDRTADGGVVLASYRDALVGEGPAKPE